MSFGFKPRQPLAPLALCAIAGIVAADCLPMTYAHRFWPWAAAVGAVGYALLGLPRARKPALAWLATAALFFAWHAHLLTGSPGAALAARVSPEGCVVEAVGVVDEEPAPEARFQLRLESLTLGNTPLKTSAPVLVRWSGELPRYGDRVQLIGDIHHLTPPRNPGVFDSPKTWQRRGVTCEIRVRYPDDGKVLAHDCDSPLVARALALRHWMESTMALDIEDSPELTPLIQSMVLGSRGESLAETRQLFQYTGTMHLFAVSGMNVAMLAGICTWLLQVPGAGRRMIGCLVIPLLWLYCYATGLTASSLRATVMVTIALAGFFIERPALSWNTLGAATLALLAWNPGQLFTPGFQLSFGMVAALMAAAGPLQRWLNRFNQPDPFLPRALWHRGLILRCALQKKATEAVAVSSVAWICSMPLVAYYFHLWSPSTIPANIFAVGLAWILLILGLASVLTGTFCQGLAILFNNANWLMAKALLAGISALAAIPGGHVFIELPSLKSRPFCEMEVLDIPCGAAIHLRLNQPVRRDWLIDCGSATAFNYTVNPYLRSRGVNNLDGFLLTHGDAQHIGGTPALLEQMSPGEIVDSPLRNRSASRRSAHATLIALQKAKSILSRGDVITLAPDVQLHVLFPPEGLRSSRADDQAFVLRLDAAGRRILLSSDAGFPTETWLLENVPAEELRSDIWIKQMHASDLSGIPEFVNAVRPALLVASSTAFPPAEKLDETWAAQIEALGIRLLRQDRTGAVSISLDAGGAWKAEPFLTPAK